MRGWVRGGAPLAVFLIVSTAAPVEADAGVPVALSLRAWDRHDGIDRPFRYVFEIRPAAGEGAVELVADRRLLAFSFPRGAGSRRGAIRCRHPEAPRRVSEPRVLRLLPGERYVEWIDLRTYCWGRSAAGLADGGPVHVTYGFARRGRDRWVARREVRGSESSPSRLPVVSLRLPRNARPSHTDAVDGADDAPRASPVHARLADASVSRGDGLTLRAEVRAVHHQVRLFMRAEDWSFLVDGPLGRVRCSLPRGGGVPAPDLYRRVTARRGSAVILDVARFCPSDTFALPGIYALRPTLHLTQAGAEYGLAAVAGRFEGPPAWVRVTRGDGGYFEQIPEGGAE